MPEPSVETEENLARRARNGDTDAFDRLVIAYMRPVYGLAYRMTGNHADADDATQAAFIQAFKNMGRFEPGSNFRAWVLTIAANLCIDLRRKWAIRRRAYLPPGLAAQAVDPSAKMEAEEEGLRARAALDALPEDQRAVMLLHVMEDVPLAEIARNSRCPEGTVRWRFFQARNKLKEWLEPAPASADRGRVPAKDENQ